MYHSPVDLGMVAINVQDLQRQTIFYQKVLGLKLLTHSQDQVDLGVGGRSLVRLIQTQDPGQSSQAYGLYHLAILLPSRQDLGDIFRFFIDNKIPLIGASDHGYSEAIYLEDIEGNGIEIYADRPMDTWDIRPDGRIIGITEPMDAQGIYSLGKPIYAYQMPEASQMGHVHLSVKESGGASHFYQEILGLKDKFSIATGAWLAWGDYHHHLAVNEWGGKGLKTRTKDMPGLAYYSLIYHKQEDYLSVLDRARQAQVPLEIYDQSAMIMDRDGIRTLISYK